MLNDQWFRRAFAEGRRRAMVSLLLVPAALFAVTALVRVPGVEAQATPQTANPQAPPVQDPGTKAQTAVTGQSNPAESQVETLENPAPPATGEAAVPSSAVQTPQSAAAPRPQPASVPQAVPAPPSDNPGEPQSPAAPEVPRDAEGSVTLDVGPMPEIPKMPAMKIVIPKIPAMLNDEMPQLMALGKLDEDFSLMAPGDGMFLMPNGGRHGYAYYFSSNGDSWAIVDGTGRNVSMGSGRDKQQLDLAQRMAKGPFLWFTHAGKSYIVDDPAVVARIQSLYAPMRELGRQQEALGVQQGVMGRMQGELARQQRTDATVRIPDLSKEMADAEAALRSLKSQQGQMLSEQKLAEMQSKLAEMEARLGTLQARSAMRSDFGERMRALGDQQRQLGDRQRELGEQQKKLATQAQQQVQSLIEECLHNGKATLVKE